MADTPRDLLAGAAAGFAATGPMTAVMDGVRRLLPALYVMIEAMRRAKKSGAEPRTRRSTGIETPGRTIRPRRSAQRRLPREQRELRALFAACAVDDGACNAASMRDHREDVAPHRGILASAVVDDDHAAFGHVVNVVANRAGRNTGSRPR